jgi:hypothetical protein
MAKQNKKAEDSAAPEVMEKVLGEKTPEVKEEKFVSILDPDLGGKTQIEDIAEEEEVDEDVMYTLKDNVLFIPGTGTLVKDPQNPKPLSAEHLKTLFDYAASVGVSKEIAIKKHLVRIRLVEVKNILPVQPTRLEKYVVDKGE